MGADIKEILQKIADSVEFGDIENVGVNTHGIFRNTPMHVAISWRDSSALSVLIENNANINAKGECGLTPLHHAIMMENYDAIDILLANRVNISIKSDDGDDAISLARKVGNTKILEKLLMAQKLLIN